MKMATLAGIGIGISGGTRVAVSPSQSSSSSFILRTHSYSLQTHRRPNTLIRISRNVPRKCFSSISASSEQQVRVRFAPSPTGNLHVGGARTALFNYLFARSKGGKFILRIEDTDLERSTKESEEAVLRDLSWLGLTWDEGPGDAGGDYGPYRQSERNDLYKQYANKLLNTGQVYRCFCSNQELEQMKEIAKEKQLPPVYTGKWATATEEEVQEELAKGTPFTYRFRVPKEGSLKINDLIRGEVTWNLDTLGDFVVMRSNGQPVYNFCVTVDDATMAITHVIRAEEHLPNTLRQALIYKALEFPMPAFAHVSLILAPDRSKLSKRHGATSVGQFREMGFLPQAIVNYLALLGWSDGTNDEFFTLDQLVEKFSINRVNKSGAIFDSTKLRWMNGQHLKALPTEELIKTIGEQWRSAGILIESEGLFVEDAYKLLEGGMDVITDAEKLMSDLLSYPFHDTLSSSEGRQILEDGLPAVARVCLDCIMIGKLHGPDMGESIVLIYRAGTSGIVAPEVGFVTLEQRLKSLKEVNWEAFSQAEETATVAAH
ncbi:glutamate--tRNA ligase, chloroplastic/mitochondrial [Tanacetum coccineum]